MERKSVPGVPECRLGPQSDTGKQGDEGTRRRRWIWDGQSSSARRAAGPDLLVHLKLPLFCGPDTGETFFVTSPLSQRNGRRVSCPPSLGSGFRPLPPGMHVPSISEPQPQL